MKNILLLAALMTSSSLLIAAPMGDSNQGNQARSRAEIQFDDSVGQVGPFMAPDACNNIVGYQAAPPTGYGAVNGSCLAPCSAPADTFVDQDVSCPSGSGQRRLRTTTTYQCLDAYAPPASASSTVEILNTCNQSTWPWEAIHGQNRVSMMMQCSSSLDYLNPTYCKDNDGNHPQVQDNFADITRPIHIFYNGDSYRSLGRSSYGSYWLNGEHHSDMFKKLDQFLSSQGFKVFSMNWMIGAYEQNIFSFTAGKNGNLFVGWSLPTNRRPDFYKTRPSNRYVTPMPRPYSGYVGQTQSDGTITPNRLGTYTYNYFDESASWKWGSAINYVLISPPMPSQYFNCGEASYYRRNTRAAGNLVKDYLYKEWCVVGVQNETFDEFYLRLGVNPATVKNNCLTSNNVTFSFIAPLFGTSSTNVGNWFCSQYEAGFKKNTDRSNTTRGPYEAILSSVPYFPWAIPMKAIPDYRSLGRSY